MPLQIKFQIIDAQPFCLMLRGPSQYRSHAREQFRKRERLYQIIICAEFESFHAVAHTVTRSQEENGCTHVTCPELSDDFHSVLLRQHNINNQKIEFICARLLEARLAVARDGDAKSGFAQSLG